MANPNGYRVVSHGGYVTPVACSRGLYRARQVYIWHLGRKGWLFHFKNFNLQHEHGERYCYGDTFEQAWIEFLGSVGAV